MSENLNGVVWKGGYVLDASSCIRLACLDMAVMTRGSGVDGMLLCRVVWCVVNCVCGACVVYTYIVLYASMCEYRLCVFVFSVVLV